MNPFSGLDVNGIQGSTDLVEHIVGRLDNPKVDGIVAHLIGAQLSTIGSLCVALHVGVGVDQTRDHGFTFQVNPYRVRTRLSQDFGAATHRRDFAVADGHGFGHREILIDCQDLAVVQDHVGALLG